MDKHKLIKNGRGDHMEKVKAAFQTFVEDINSEESTIIEAFGLITNWLFKLILFLGVPFFIFVFGQFIRLI